jgi:hypothetical protein
MRSKAIRKERRANAWVGRPHIELFIAGTAAELPALEQALRSMLDVASFETFSLAPQPSGELYRSYFGSLIDEGLPSLAGKRLLLHFSAEGGSYSAVASMLRAEPVTRMDVSDECEASAQLGRWFCRNLVWDRVPDGGISESDPAQARSFDPARPVVTVEELMQLDAAPVNRLRWGIEVSHALKASGVQRIPPAALRSIVSGSASSWAEVDRRLREMPIVLCRQPDAAAPMTLLGLACAIGAPKGSSVASASPGIITAPGRLVREVSSYADVRQCLYEADHGASILTDWGSMQLLPGSYAIAFLPRTSAGDDDRNWLSDDLGETTAWMQWLKANNSNMGRRPTAEQLAVLRRLRQMMSDAQLASLIPGALALSPAQRDGPQVPSARACAADARP